MIHRPAGEITLGNALEQVALMALAVLGNNRFRFLVGQVLDALLGAQVEFDPDTFILGIDHAEGVTAKAMHVAVGIGNTAVAHDDGDLMQRFGEGSPEIPVVGGGTQVGLRIAFDSPVEIREFVRIAQEEDRGVVADQVPVAFFGVELHGKAADVAFCIGCTAFPGDGGEAHESFGFLADLGKDLGLGVFGDVMGDGEFAKGARSLGMHTALRDHLPVKMSQFFQIPDILQQHGPARTGGHGILIIGYRGAGCGGQFLFLGHWNLLF